ncbi:UNVERIFIED_CONTAM: hypothetical protein K2H54_040485 [Gekko kuhli]
MQGRSKYFLSGMGRIAHSHKAEQSIRINTKQAETEHCSILKNPECEGLSKRTRDKRVMGLSICIDHHAWYDKEEIPVICPFPSLNQLLLPQAGLPASLLLLVQHLARPQ